MKCIVPSFQAFDLFGIAPPKGRGGVLHRHVQRLVTEGATTKGYRVMCEKDIGNGAIVDVHLEKEGRKIAVEIAIASKPDLEMRHMRNCLTAGYDQIFCIFADENLLLLTKRAVQGNLSQEETKKVRLLPLNMLSSLG